MPKLLSFLLSTAHCFVLQSHASSLFPSLLCTHYLGGEASDYCQNPTLKSSEQELSRFQALPEYFPLVTGRQDN